MNNFIKVLVSLILLGVIGVGGYFGYTAIKNSVDTKEDTKQEQVQDEEKDNVNIDNIDKIVIDVEG